MISQAESDGICTVTRSHKSIRTIQILSDTVVGHICAVSLSGRPGQCDLHGCMFVSVRIDPFLEKCTLDPTIHRTEIGHSHGRS